MVDQITTEEVFQFFKKKNISPSCVQCGHYKSSIFSTDEPHRPKMAKIVLHFYDDAGHEIDSRAQYDTIPLVCDNCGNIRTFLTETILKSMKETENE
ncbi:hypothetical protein L1D19_05645 [Vibrio natriegens]|uniref:hypothetical protein n=1 Tax=Vibrio natriegens TaxID=691 RepID=UPI001EFE8168|nr:hypothetical protein [Vibrio natriegens]MCG9699614.1 hypothetical protein [Vibrio natriegens]